MSRHKKNITVVIILTIISLIMLEILLRIFAPPPALSNSLATLDAPNADVYGWALPPNYTGTLRGLDSANSLITYTTNSRGWKDVEHELDKPDGAVRILFLGDSTTFSYNPVEDSYPRQVERLLHEMGYEQVEVISIGISGWGTDQSLEALLYEGVLYNPDLIIHQFTSNDIENNVSPHPGLGPDSI